MACKSPIAIRGKGIIVGCGQCLFCRIKKRHIWTARLLLERVLHEKCIFITLTYKDDCLPSPPSVSKRELQLFFKRLRRAIEPKKIRFYACGEYGEQKLRPHYHAIIFGLDSSYKKIIFDCWNKCEYERLDCQDVGTDPAVFSYVAGYVAKKYTKEKDDRIKSGELEKEFTLMSRRPAIGSGMVASLAQDAFIQHPFDVLKVIRVGKKNFPLDRTIRQKIKDLVMTSEEQAHIQKLNIQLLQEELLELVKEQLPDQVKDFRFGRFQEDNFNYNSFRQIAGEAYHLKYREELDMRERLMRTHSIRKDL